MKSGQSNNGYLPNITDYSPSQATLLSRNGKASTNTSVDASYYPNSQISSVNSTLVRNRTTKLVDSRQDNGLPNVHGSFNSLQNGLISECNIQLILFKKKKEAISKFCFLLKRSRSTATITKWLKHRFTLSCHIWKSIFTYIECIITTFTTAKYSESSCNASTASV